MPVYHKVINVVNSHRGLMAENIAESKCMVPISTNENKEVLLSAHTHSETTLVEAKFGRF